MATAPGVGPFAATPRFLQLARRPSQFRRPKCASGVIVELNGQAITFTGDTGPTQEIWKRTNKTTGVVVETTDPGRALITGKWKDIGRFKGPILRALATRAPYFHNGFAADLDAAVDFYNQRFDIGLTPQEHDDLVAFLRTL